MDSENENYKLNKSELVSRIRKTFPDLKFKRAQHNTEGWDHYILILDNKYVFRFPLDDEYKDKLKTEIELLDYLHDKVKVPLPKYKFIAPDKSFAGYEMLQGMQLKKEIFQKLPESVKRTIAKQIAQFINAMHNVPLNAAKKFQPGMDQPNKVYKDTLTNTRKIVFPKISKKDRNVIEEFLKELKLTVNYPRKAFIHYDLYPSHILLAPNRKSLSGIIDFGDRAIDDPAVEFCELWIYGRKFVEDVYSQYTGPKDPQFLDRSMLYYKRVPIWMMIDTLKFPKGSFRENYKMFKDIFFNPKTFK